MCVAVGKLDCHDTAAMVFTFTSTCAFCERYMLHCSTGRVIIIAPFSAFDSHSCTSDGSISELPTPADEA